ncbi:hypothetical protein TNCT_680881 [Trichonephila clavata]|uniref:Uncharacterized protein n=1 Tax=Trichonephila clavata TaxID=2740835 RepID=A0A8X6GEC1_TRICU|nr:hypothetical protein TNCT_680881 [Trichonephila clavata]
MKLVYYLLKLWAWEKDFRARYVWLVFKIHALSTRPYYLLAFLKKVATTKNAHRSFCPSKEVWRRARSKVNSFQLFGGLPIHQQSTRHVGHAAAMDTGQDRHQI